MDVDSGAGAASKAGGGAIAGRPRFFAAAVVAVVVVVAVVGSAPRPRRPRAELGGGICCEKVAGEGEIGRSGERSRSGRDVRRAPGAWNAAETRRRPGGWKGGRDARRIRAEDDEGGRTVSSAVVASAPLASAGRPALRLMLARSSLLTSRPKSSLNCLRESTRTCGGIESVSSEPRTGEVTKWDARRRAGRARTRRRTFLGILMSCTLMVFCSFAAKSSAAWRIAAIRFSTARDRGGEGVRLGVSSCCGTSVETASMGTARARVAASTPVRRRRNRAWWCVGKLTFGLDRLQLPLHLPRQRVIGAARDARGDAPRTGANGFGLRRDDIRGHVLLRARLGLKSAPRASSRRARHPSRCIRSRPRGTFPCGAGRGDARVNCAPLADAGGTFLSASFVTEDRETAGVDHISRLVTHTDRDSPKRSRLHRPTFATKTRNFFRDG